MSLAFDATYYQTTRPDVFNAFVATQGSTGLTWAAFAEQHFNTFGWVEGSNPNANFNTSEYLSANLDVAAAGVNPFSHFLEFGSLEGRLPYTSFPLASLDTAAYATANPDLAAAGITTEAQLQQHFMLFGQFESRPSTPTVTNPNLDGQTYTLTTGPDEITGTANNDTFRAVVTNSLDDTDILDGGAGTDTINIDADGAAAGAAPVISNIEIMNNARGAALDLASVTGLEQAWSVDAANTWNNAVLSTIFGVRNFDANLTVSINADYSGTSDTLQLATDNIDTGDTVTIDSDTAGDADDVEAVSILASTDSAGTLNIDFFTDFTSLTVTGDGNLIIDDLASTDLATVTAGSAGGDLTIDTGASTQDITVTTGSGNDTLTVDGAGAQTVDGGAGNDTITTGAGNDTITGGTGNDILDGAAGNDTITGGDGNDQITVSGAANDTDTVTGGAGTDSFIFDVLGTASVSATAISAMVNQDTVTDFAAADDSLLLSNAAFASLGTAGNVTSPGALTAGRYVEVSGLTTASLLSDLETAATNAGAPVGANSYLAAASIGTSVYVFYDAAQNAADDVSLVAILQNTDLDGISAADFGIIA
jgi:Ca2+-binding RTX toxin-like protein